MKTTFARFNIEAGKYEHDGTENYKYLNSADNCSEAMKLYADVQDYPFARVYLNIEEDGQTKRILVAGDHLTDEHDTTLELQLLHTEVAHTWMTITGNQFAEVREGISEVYLNDIADHYRRMKVGYVVATRREQKHEMDVRELRARINTIKGALHG